MPITRKFVGWSIPALEAAAAYLLERQGPGDVVDLEEVVVVTPGSRAGRRLLEILVQRCEEAGRVLAPPQIKTVGRLPELLYESKRPFASDLVQQLAWVHALRAEGRRKLSRVIPALPDETDVPRWLELGKLLWRLHRELAAEGLDFRHVVDTGWKRAEAEEKHRWKLLRRVQEKYLRILDHYELWDLQTARLYAIEHQLCRCRNAIVLVGAADMNRALRLMLEQVAERVTALVFAPESLADHFDAEGCVEPDIWQHAEIDLDQRHVVLAEGPHEQADEVAAALAAFDGRYRADEISIGAPDPSLAPQIQRRLEEAGLRMRGAVGRTAGETGLYRLLAAVAAFLERGRFEDFAGLMRHPDVFRWVQNNVAITGDWLTELDQYYSEHLPPRLGKWLGEPPHHEQIAAVYEAVQELLRPLGEGRRKLSDWAAQIVSFVQVVYADVELDRGRAADHYTLEAAEELHRCLVQQQATPAELMPVVLATQAIRLLLDQLKEAEFAPLSDPQAIELLGWLELPLDTAPALIVTSFNEGFVPTSVNADMFLPNRLRRRLGLLDNRRRYARDAYALSLLLASRRELTLIVGRRNQEGEPLAPSRLLFATNARTMARRCQRFFEGEPPESREPQPSRRERQAGETEQQASAPSRIPSQSEIYVPRPVALATPIEAMSVTSFRDYIACPYRFYLRHVLQLRGVADAAEELDAPTFGSLLHDVLNRFGRSELRTSTNADHIRSFLKDALKKLVFGRYGATHLAAVNVQLVQAGLRLDAFARWQAEWTAAGWEIAYAETPEGADRAELDLGGGECMGLYGRIDRVDRLRDGEQWMIFDYKTSETPKTPDQAHRRRDEWVDLQLPLYQHFSDKLGVDGPVGYGYIVLPKDTAKVGALLADWSEAELASADQLARRIARAVRAAEFWPPADPAPSILTDYGAICQEQAFDRQFEIPDELPLEAS